MFGPQLWSSSADSSAGGDQFPSIRDTVASGNWTLAQLTVDRVASILKAAAAALEVPGKNSS